MLRRKKPKEPMPHVTYAPYAFQGGFSAFLLTIL